VYAAPRPVDRHVGGGGKSESHQRCGGSEYGPHQRIETQERHHGQHHVGEPVTVEIGSGHGLTDRAWKKPHTREVPKTVAGAEPVLLAGGAPLQNLLPHQTAAGLVVVHRRRKPLEVRQTKSQGHTHQQQHSHQLGPTLSERSNNRLTLRAGLPQVGNQIGHQQAGKGDKPEGQHPRFIDVVPQLQTPRNETEHHGGYQHPPTAGEPRVARRLDPRVWRAVEKAARGKDHGNAEHRPEPSDVATIHQQYLSPDRRREGQQQQNQGETGPPAGTQLWVGSSVGTGHPSLNGILRPGGGRVLLHP